MNSIYYWAMDRAKCIHSKNELQMIVIFIIDSSVISALDIEWVNFEHAEELA
ncbi:hypothetical protein VII_003441 [Vibrio mimicus MB451]|nr:hypothetical protein VII_003441 [Vibrio mimicus MB451]